MAFGSVPVFVYSIVPLMEVQTIFYHPYQSIIINML